MIVRGGDRRGEEEIDWEGREGRGERMGEKECIV